MVQRFLKIIEPKLRIAADFDFQLWSDRHIALGEDWRQKINQALDESFFGLLLVSPAFLGSKFIVETELPKLLNNKSLVIPVGLQPILFDGTMNLKGLGERQLFRDAQHRFFSRCHAAHTRDEFATQLFSRLYGQLKSTAARGAAANESALAAPGEPRESKRALDLAALLSPRELQIARLIVAGQTSKEIAQVLSLHLQTIRAYRKHLMAKLGVASSVQLVLLLQPVFAMLERNDDSQR